jgi:hypothetical protein
LNVRDRYATRAGIVVLVTTISLVVILLLVSREWAIPALSEDSFWSGLVAFTLLGIASDSAFLNISRGSVAGVSSSVVFVPLISTVLLYDHPWPMVIAGTTALVVESLVQRKPAIRVWFNTAQYMLAIGLGSWVYTALGGSVSASQFTMHLGPFLVLVAVYLAANNGSVSLAVCLSNRISIRESWARVVGGSLLYDFAASGLALLLVFLYVHLHLIGLALLVVPLFLVRHMYQVTLQVERANRELLELMVKAIEARDPYTSGHSVRVAEYARSIARELGLSAKLVDQIANAAIMHDVGKIYEEFAPLLRKEGKLTLEERLLMQRHPVRSAELAGTIADFKGYVELAIRHHHENYDGSGYPDGILGKAIPVGSRIIMIADTLDAMTTDRPYRKALTFERTLDELRRFAGKQFDPELVDLVANSASIRRMLGSSETEPQADQRSLNAWISRPAASWKRPASLMPVGGPTSAKSV